jgi:hypothetical protein
VEKIGQVSPARDHSNHATACFFLDETAQLKFLDDQPLDPWWTLRFQHFGLSASGLWRIRPKRIAQTAKMQIAECLSLRWQRLRRLRLYFGGYRLTH